jgi:serine protease Do
MLDNMDKQSVDENDECDADVKSDIPTVENTAAVPENTDGDISANVSSEVPGGNNSDPGKHDEKPLDLDGCNGKGKNKNTKWIVYAGILALIIMSIACIVHSIENHSQGHSGTVFEPANVPAVSESGGEYKIDNPVVDGNALSGSAIYKKAKEQVVEILAINKGQEYSTATDDSICGTGFVISADGYVVTNYHVIASAVESGQQVWVHFQTNSCYQAVVTGEDTNHDIAVLRINATGLNPVSIGDFSKSEIGDSVYVMGHSLSILKYSFTGGIISAKDRSIVTESNIMINMFQIDASVNNGSSGGPVYNDKGEVIGMVSAKCEKQGVEGLGFALEINDVVKYAEDIINYGRVPGQASLGISCRELTSDYMKYFDFPSGVYVYSITDGSAAAKAGLLKGDIIRSLVIRIFLH